jgi:LysM repeat protein
MLRHLDALRQEVAQLQRDRTNRVTQAEFQACLAKIAQVQADLEKSRESTEQNVRKIVRELMPPTAASVTIASNIAGGPIVQTYQVQKGDTFLKILARINESFEKRNMPHLTQDQLERANPSLNPNKIKAGQVIYIPAPEGAR